MSQRVDVVIVGAGPAGLSTALHLHRADPSWNQRVVVLDRAKFPREKLCGGGITNTAFEERLGIPIDMVPTMFVECVLGVGREVRPLQTGFRVVRRAEHDAALLREARARGIVVHEDADVLDVDQRDDGVVVTTANGTFVAGILVAADGSKSTVRRKLKWPGESHVARLLEVLTHEDPNAERDEELEPQLDSAFLIREQVASFDFTPLEHDLQGYYWDFPCFVGGELRMNRGVFDSRIAGEKRTAHLPEILRERMSVRKRVLPELEGHPLRWYSPDGIFSRPRILLAGDAAGVDSLLGEGITYAFDYGEVAAETIVDAFAQGSFELADYAARIRRHPHLATLDRNYRIARAVYGSRDPARAMDRIFALAEAAFEAIAEGASKG